ncbi:MAG: Ig-like domain-containing protein [Bacteroidota bacterium]
MRLLTRSAALLAAATFLTIGASAQTPGTAASIGDLAAPSFDARGGGTSLSPFFNATGNLTLSIDGTGIDEASGAIDVDKPAGATVSRAFLFTAQTPGSPLADGAVTLNGTSISYDEVVTGVLFSGIDVGRADVTSIVAALLDAAAAGITSVSYTESSTSTTDGSVLAVVFNDPNADENSVSLLFGVQAPTGDNFSIALASPFDDSETDILLSLGISFGFQNGSTNQASIIDVNGNRLTSSAGGFDDCTDLGISGCNNGELITVGGIGDDAANPPDPNQGAPVADRYDDELYTLDPFIGNGATSINVFSQNPSNDDAVFFAGFQFFGAAAIVGEGILLSPVNQTVATNASVTASVQDDDGNPISGRDVTFTVVSGPNAGASQTIATGSSGEATYSLSSTTAGTDVVEATFTGGDGNTQTSNQASITYTGGTTGPGEIIVTINTFDNTPTRGDFSFFRGPISNTGTSDESVYVYSILTGPDGGTVRTNLGRTIVPANGSVNLRDVFRNPRKNRVLIPADAPAGTYTVGVFAVEPTRFGMILDSDVITFELPAMTAKAGSELLVTDAPLGASPNPFRSETTIRYSLADDADVSLVVYDVMGREVANLVNSPQAAGDQSAVLSGGNLPAGTYIWRLAIDGEVTTGRVTLTR